MFVLPSLTLPTNKVVVVGFSIVVVLLLATGCASAGTDAQAANEAGAEAAVTAPPGPTLAPTTPPLPTSTPIPVPTATPEAVPTSIVETVTPTAIPAPVETEDHRAFCEFMTTEYFWESDTDEQFLALMPDDVPTGVMRPFRAREVLSGPGLGDPRMNSMATMVLFTSFASDLGRYLEATCPGTGGWVQTAVAHSGDADFEPVPDPLVPASDLDLCASLQALEAELDIERERRGPARPATARAAQRFASAIDPDAPFEVLAFSHLVLTQATLSASQVTFGLYLRVAFERSDRFDEEAVAAYFDEMCPTVRDTRLWLTPPRAAGAIAHPIEDEGLPDGWETVPAEEVKSAFTGDLRTLPVGEFTLLATRYPDFTSDGVDVKALTTFWTTESTDPAQGALSLGWIYEAEELPFDVSQVVVIGPDGTRYPADRDRVSGTSGVVQFVFVLDFIPETLEGVGFGIVPE